MKIAYTRDMIIHPCKLKRDSGIEGLGRRMRNIGIKEIHLYKLSIQVVQKPTHSFYWRRGKYK